MSVSNELIRQGYAAIYLDTPGSFVKDIVDYNQRAADCRRTMVHVWELKFGYTVFNPLVVFCLSVSEPEQVFRHTGLGVGILAIYAVVLIYFAFIRGNLLISSFAAVLLPVLDLLFLVLLLTDAIIVFFYERLLRPLRPQPGYPNFFEISIHYENFKTPADR